MSRLSMETLPSLRSGSPESSAPLPRTRSRILFLVLGAIAFAVVVLALGAGPLSIPVRETLEVLALGAKSPGTVGEGGLNSEVVRNHAVIWNLRMPRIVLGLLAGGALGMCGAALQGLFRNPLADPTLIGVSAGGALGAVSAIVLGAPSFLGAFFTLHAVPLSAFAGALGATALVYAVASWRRRVDVATLLLAGIAMNALAMAGIGWFTFKATDSQLRELSLWSLGSLAGVGWQGVWGTLPFVGVACALLPTTARALNIMSLGEANAMTMGIDTQRIKRVVVLASALAVGATVAFTGVIGFVGLVGPHLFRMMAGPDHRLVLPGSFLLGGVLLCLADIVARLAAAPAEIPVGIIVATLGAPLFLFLLLREKRKGEL